MRTAITFGLFVLTAELAIAQSLPPSSRTIFKCDAGGKVTYSDSPCLGAERIDVEPTRGMNAGTGRVLIGPDVRREQQREAIAGAVRPITGLDAKQFEVEGRRMKLTPEAQHECRDLDANIPAAERREKQAAKSEVMEVQLRLLTLRTRFRELRC